jgi:5-methylcytosine-specific restriction protein A
MPYAPLRACTYPGCTMLVAGGRCPRHKVETRRPGRALDKRFYDSAHWQRVRDMKLKRDPVCQYCLHGDKLTTATEVDHYTPLERGGHRTEDANLVSSCKSCHSRKTQLDQQGQPPPPYAPSATARYDCA